MISASVLDQTIAELEQRKEKIRKILELQSQVFAMENRLITGDNVNKAAHIIMSIVCEHFRVTPDQLKSRKRSEDIAMPRQVFMFILRKDCDITLEACGKLVGRDHGTVMHAERAISDRMETDLKFAAALANIREECRVKAVMEIAEV